MEIRIERGVPTAEELAALVGVLSLLSAARAEQAPPVSRWARATRPGYWSRPGKDAWRASGLPR